MPALLVSFPLAAVLAVPPTWPPDATERAPEPSPQQQLEMYRYKERARLNGTVAGLALVGLGSSFATLPWVILAIRQPSGFYEPYGELFTSWAGVGVAGLGAVITLGSGIALHRLRKQGPPSGLAARMRVSPGGITLRF